jgi:TPR repeat protein
MKKIIALIGLLAACTLLALFALKFRADSSAAPKKPAVPEVLNIEEVRAGAERGEAEAQMKLGKTYAKGIGVKQDYKEAGKWYRQAAEKGHAAAQTALAELYEVGQGVPRDEAEAAKWYRRAAEQGNAAGQYGLAVLYVDGRGVPQSDAEAIKWYQKAAEQGDALAQYNLGMRYYEARGFKQDFVEAYKWFSLASPELPDAARMRDKVKTILNRDQLAEGRRRAETFAPQKTPGR